MTYRRNRVGARMILGVLVWALAAGISAAGRSPAAGNPASPAIEKAAAPVLPAAPQASGFVGDDTCTACHESEGKVFAGTLHGKAQNVRTPSAKMNQACETCHGPGKDHAESGDKDKI